MAVKHTFRAINGAEITVEKMNKAKSIKLMCTLCMGDDENPKDCTSPLCPLFPFRGRCLLALGSVRKKKDVEEVEEIESDEDEKDDE